MGAFQSQLAVTCCGRNCDHKLCGYRGPCEAPHGAHGAELVIYVAKKIVTMDPSWPEATAVAVQDGRVISVGSLETLRPLTERPGTRFRIDRTFADLVLTPGFIEQHNHPLIGGTAMSILNISSNDTPNPFGPDYPACRSKADVLQRLREEDQRLPAGEDMVAWGWDSVVLSGHLHRKDLDSVSTTRVIAVWDRSLHCGYCNTYTMEKLGVTAKAWGKVEGVVMDNDGTLSGQFLALRALAALRPVFGKVLAPRRALHSMRYLTELARQGGVTTTCEMMQGGINLMLERLLYSHFFNDDACPVRCVCTVDAAKAIGYCGGSTQWAVNWVRNLQKESTGKLMYNNGVKFFTDDAFVALTMQVGYPGYLDGRKGIWNTVLGDKYVQKMLPWWKAGCRIHVHSNGDAAQDATAEVLQALQHAKPRFDHRFCFEHYGMSSESLTRRLKALGASAAVNVYYPYHRGEVNEGPLGTDRAHTASRLKTLVDNGVPCAMHTDSPIAPPRPLEEMWFAVNRQLDSGKVLAPAERVTPQQALRMKTVDAAYVLGLDGLLGSIEAGKLADFTVLHESPLDCEPTKIREIRIWGTVVNGVPHPVDEKWELQALPPPGLVEGVLWLMVATARPGWRRALAAAASAAWAAFSAPGGRHKAAALALGVVCSLIAAARLPRQLVVLAVLLCAVAAAGAARRRGAAAAAAKDAHKGGSPAASEEGSDSESHDRCCGRTRSGGSNGSGGGLSSAESSGPPTPPGPGLLQQ